MTLLAETIDAVQALPHRAGYTAKLCDMLWERMEAGSFQERKQAVALIKELEAEAREAPDDHVLGSTACALP